MSKRIFVDGSINSELCIIAADGQEINYFDYSDELATTKKNNIYLGIVSRVEPSLQAAFIEFGSEKKGFLPFDEIHPSYFKIPHEEKINLNENSKNKDENDIKENKKNFLSLYRKYKIQDVIKKDQVLLIQIVKEERGTKGAAMTSFISLPGRYSVLLPNNSSSGGVSKKISNQLDRKRLKNLHDNLDVVKVMTEKSLNLSNFPLAKNFMRKSEVRSKNIYHHLGIYCYQLETLKKFVAYNQSSREIKNKLEQLRALDNGISINVSLAKESPIGVDTKEDFVAIKKIMEYKT